MAEKRVQINKVVKDQLPSYVKDDNPLIGEFLSAYYQGQEYQGGPIDIINNLDSYIQLNKSGTLVGFTTLSSAVTQFDQTISVEDTTGFPENYGLLKINDEIITYTGLTTNSFTGCIRGFSGITSFSNPDEPEEFLFSTSKAGNHAVGVGTSGGQVENLSALFLKEFLKKSKKQFLPGFQRDLNPALNQPQFIRHSKDFYNSRGTDESFKILFKALFNENVDIVRPADYVIAPSDANYRKTRDIIVEAIQGDPMDLENKTLFQDEFENLSRAYGPVSMVERVRVGLLTETYYKVSIDASFGTGSSDELLYGNFGIHANSKNIGRVGAAQTFIDVDSTIGFPDKGALTFVYQNGTVGVCTYSGTNITQFLGISTSGITTTISDATSIRQNTYVYALGQANSTAGVTTDGIRCRITGVLSGIELPDTFYQRKDAKIKLKSLGKVANIDDFKSNNWIFNVQPKYNIDSITLQDASGPTYEVVTKDFHRIRLNDAVTVQTNNLTLDGSYNVTDVLSNVKFRMQGSTINNLSAIVAVTKTLAKPNSNASGVDNNQQHLNDYTANVQNVYMEEVGYAHTLSKLKNLIASNSLPTYGPNHRLNPSTQKISLSGTFEGGQIILPITTGDNDHNFFSGDAIYYTPQKQSDGTIDSFLFSEGLYFVERVDKNNIKLAKSRSNLFNEIYQKVSESTVTTTITSNTFEKYEFHKKQVLPQKLFREIDMPVYDGKKYPTKIGYNGILINGVEILSYKSPDICYYGDIKSIDVTGGGRNYDVINPPFLAINDATGVGATGFVATRGILQEIRVLDPGFDFIDVPKISISGGNGSGATAECKMVTVPHQVVFNAGSTSQTVAISTTIVKNSSGVNTEGNYNIGFSTYHKFRNHEQVIYDTFGEKALTGLTTGAVYYINTDTPTGITTISTFLGYAGETWFPRKTIRLHRNLNEAVAGINTIAFTAFGEGNHQFRSFNGKSQVGSINVLNPGEGYENKLKTCEPAGINTALDRITINNHDYKTGEIITYTADPDGTAIEGLASDKKYYVFVVDENTFKLSTVGVGTTAKDFYFRTKQYQNLRSIGFGTHSFNYDPIVVTVQGLVGIDPIEGKDFQCIPQPLFRGEITSIHLTNNGVGYGASEILNFNRQPRIDMYTGVSGELLPVVANGQIIDVAIQNRGQSYNTPPSISITGVGTGAELVPEIVNGQLRSIRIAKPGIGYGASTTSLNVISAGEFGIFNSNLKTWQVNEVRKNFANIDDSDTFIDKPTQISRELQISHAYAPRGLRKIVYQNDSNGDPLYGSRDLTLLNGATEEDKTQHSPIIGWAYDGLPIYGPYGFEKSTGGSVTQLKSGYSIDLKENRPPTSVFPQEFFLEDFTWNSSTDESFLDENNGRYGVTPEYPNGIYAYYATFESTVTSDSTDPFNNFKKPKFPYLLGDNFHAQPNQFNYQSKNNQDEINLNQTSWVRNTEPYELLQDDSFYNYVSQSHKSVTQEGTIVYASEGAVDKIGIVTGGSSYQVGDKLVFEEAVAENFETVAKVSRVRGPGIGTIAVTNVILNNIEFYPANETNTFVGVHTTPIGLSNLSKISVSGLSTTSSKLDGKSYNIGISSAKLIVSEGIGSVAATGLVTFFTVQGRLPLPNDNLNNLNLRENDILKVGIGTRQEEVKLLNIDAANSRIRVLRNQNNLEDGVIGASHTIRTPIIEDPRKFRIDVGFTTEFDNRINFEYYFDPAESLGVAASAGPGIGTTVFISNPAGGRSSIFIPSRSIFLPNHKFKTGDVVTYHKNTGNSIGISTSRANANLNVQSANLLENVPLFLVKLSDDLVGLSTVKVGLATAGGGADPEDVFVGVGNTLRNQGLVYFTGIGTGRYHSLRISYDSTVKGTANKNLATVSVGNSHGLKNNDRVFLTVDAGITTTVPIKYNKENRKLIARTLDFTVAGVNTSGTLDGNPNTIRITDHRMVTGQRVVHTANTPVGGLVDQEEYFVYVIDKNVIKLCGSRFQTRQSRPVFVNLDVSSVGAAGTLNLVNPPLEFYKNGTVTFDLSDSSLSFTKVADTLPAFDLELYTDYNFIHEYTSNEKSSTFNVTRTGTVGIDGKLVLTYNQHTPKILYYNLVANTSTDNPDVNKELVLDKEILGNNSISFKDSLFAGQFNVIANSTNTFTYDLDTFPEESSYVNSDTTSIVYDTTSKTAYGPIASIVLAEKGRGYTRLPGVSTVTSDTGTGAILEASSTSIGVPKTTRLESIGFDYPSDFTLRPQSKLPQIIKIDALSGLREVGITSYGRGYNHPPALVVLDGITRVKDEDVDLAYNLTTPDRPGYVDIIENTFGLSNVTPFIVPVNNPNGIRVTNLVYDASTETVAATLKSTYSLAENFPIEVGDRVLVENASVGVGSTGKGFDSLNYAYRTFEVTQVHQNLGNIGIVTYSMSGLVPSGEVPGNFNINLSSAILVKERDFPQFAPILQRNTFNTKETLVSETSVGPVSGLVAEYDEASQWLTIEAASDFEVGKLIESTVTGAKGIVSEIVLTFDTNFLVDYFSLVNNGWEYETGFLSNVLQVSHDNEYYQRFSYAIKSRVFFDKWKDIVNTITHTAGFQKFSNLQVESNLPVAQKSAMVVGIAGTITGIIDLQGFESLHEVDNFDLVTENLKSRSPADGNLSDEITFQNRILIDYAESVGNRVLTIDNISSDFNDLPRTTPFSEVGRFSITGNKENRFMVYVKDRLFEGERQIMMVNALFDPISGQSMINQYGSVDTVRDLGSMDTEVDGNEAVLRFFPTKSEFNNYNVTTLSYNLNELGLTTSLTAGISTSIGSGSNPVGALVHIGAATTLGGSAHGGGEVIVATVGTASTTGTPSSGNKAPFEMHSPRSAKTIVAIATSEGTVEYNELSMVMHQSPVGLGSTVAFEQYGQLTIHNRRDGLAAEPLGTFRPHIVGLGTTAQIQIGFTPNAGIKTAFINSITIGISSEAYTGVGTVGLKNASLIAKSTTIAAAGSPSATGIGSYGEEFDAAYAIVQVKDTTNDRYEFAEIMMVDDDSRVFMTEYGNIVTGAGVNANATGIGTISGAKDPTGCFTEIKYTPNANTAVEVKTFIHALKVVEDNNPNQIELQSGSIQTKFDVYEGTFFGSRTNFPILNETNQVFKKDFDGSSTDIVNLTNNTISIPNHFFVTGEEVEYAIAQPIVGCTTTGIGSTGDAIGIAITNATSPANVSFVPSSVFIIKVSDSLVKLAATAQNALRSIAVPLDLNSVGVGTSHSLISKNQNTRALISIDNIIQSPIVGTGVTTSLGVDFVKGQTVMFTSGITSFFANDVIKVGNEMMKVIAVENAGISSAIRVHRNWMGTDLLNHSNHDIVEKMAGNYNIVDSTLNFAEAPKGGRPISVGSTGLPSSDRDFTGITTTSSFSGRIFNRSGIKGGNFDAYSRNYAIDDISQQFTGIVTEGSRSSVFTLQSDKQNLTGIATNLGIVLVNGILQGAGQVNDYELSEVAGITSITFTGTASTVGNDVQRSTVPVGGVIISVASSEGFGYQPLVGAGATIHFNNIGVATAVSIGNSGSGYRVKPGPAIAATFSSISGVGIATVVNVSVATTTSGGTPIIQNIGTAAVLNGRVVSIAVTNTNPIPGIGTQNPSSVGTGQSTFIAIIDKPLPYHDIPLWYDNTSTPGVGGSQARANITVGVATTGGRVIDFEITNTGYGYGNSHVLTVPTFASAPNESYAIPIDAHLFKPFKLTVQKVHHDEFNMWTMGELQMLDDFSSLFNGSRKAFPLTVGGESFAIQARTGSGIDVKNTIILTINDVLQVPGEGYEFDGGGTITFTEAPNEDDVMRMFFYRGTGGEDVQDRDIVETVKVGDDLQVKFGPAYNTRTFVEFPRAVHDLLSIDRVETNQYYGVGIGDDDTEVRPVKWYRQLEDRFIDGKIVRKDRPIYEPKLFPTTYLTQSIAIGQTVFFTDSCKPFFNPKNENAIDRSFQNAIEIVNASSEFEFITGAAATAIVSIANTIQHFSITEAGDGYTSVPEVRIQQPISIGGTPFIGIGTTATAIATATVTNGSISSITVGINSGIVGSGYTSAAPPVVLIAPPTYIREENDVDLYEGDFGVISGVGICSNISDANGTGIFGSGIGTALVFDLFIPPDSQLRDNSVNSPNSIVRSGLQTGYIFTVRDSNVGSVVSGITALSRTGVTTVGVGTHTIDGIYEVAHHVGITTVGFGTNKKEVATRVFVRIDNWNGIQNTVGYATLGQGISSSFVANYSWGRMQLRDRQLAEAYTVNTFNGISGIKTGPQIKRKAFIKAENFVVPEE